MLLPIGVAALIQGAYIATVHRTLLHNGDAVYYDLQADLLRHGLWFISPYDAVYKLGIDPSASHPPVTTLVLALADVLGASSWTSHMAVMGVVFVAAVFVAGLVGKALAGGRAGVLVALVVAVYPYLWVNSAAVLAETLVILLMALLLWAVLRFWKQPRWTVAAEIGVYLGLAALTRTELVLLVVLIGIPIVLLCRTVPLRKRPILLVAMGVAFVVIVGPWVGRNMVVFHHREYLSSQGGVTLATANCDISYYGNLEGWWSFKCHDKVRVPAGADESDVDKVMRRAGETYIKRHAGRALAVVGIRVLRTWNFYRPIQQTQMDRLDARPLDVSQAGLVCYYVLAPLAVAGAVILRRRRVLVFPLVALIVMATISVVLTYANGRYRVEGDLAVAILAGITLDALVGAAARRGHARHVRRAPPAAAPGRARTKGRAFA